MRRPAARPGASEAFSRTVPARSIRTLRACRDDLDDNNRCLYWAGEALLLLNPLPAPTDVHAEHVAAMLDALDLDAWERAFFDRLSVRGGPTRFWVRYLWLFALVCDRDDVLGGLLIEDPPHSYEGSAKSWFVERRLRGCPVPCRNSPAGIVLALEQRKRRRALQSALRASDGKRAAAAPVGGGAA